MRPMLIAAMLLLNCSTYCQAQWFPGKRVVQALRGNSGEVSQCGSSYQSSSSCRLVNGVPVCTNTTIATQTAPAYVEQAAVVVPSVASTVHVAPVVQVAEVQTFSTDPLMIQAVADGDGEHHQRTLAAVKKAIQDSDSLSDWKKRRLLRKLDRPWVAVRVTDEITSRAMATGLVSVSVDSTGGAVTNIDWDGLIKFIEALVPLIIQIVGLFG